MSIATYDLARTALLLVDPYNDFLAEKGKLWPRLKEVAEKAGTLPNMQRLLAAARTARLQVVFVPHHRSEPTDFVGWKHPTPYQLTGAKAQVFAKGTWGGEFYEGFEAKPGDVVAKEHWASNGFANTDLDHQLRQHGIEQIVVAGMIANTCIEATSRGAIDLGYHVTLVKDATAAFTHEAMHAAHALNGPTFAHAIATTDDFLEKLEAARRS
jgi:nicotinamidase-related amidase